VSDELAVDHAVEPMTLTAAIPSRWPPTPPITETSSAWDRSSKRERISKRCLAALGCLARSTMEQMESGTTTPLRDKESLPDRYAAARTYLRRADPVLGRLIDEHPDFDPRRWTAQLPDVFPSGDLALRRAARRLYGLERLPTEQELLDIAERWKPYRSLAAGYLFLSEFDAKP
jgi:hypothetical protein